MCHFITIYFTRSRVLVNSQGHGKQGWCQVALTVIPSEARNLADPSKRIVAMIRTVGLVAPLMLSGGVARNEAIRKMLEEETQTPVIVPKHPQLMGAYGAALLGMTS